MGKFATYLHPHTCYTSKPDAQIQFVGHSQPHFDRVRAELANQLTHLPSIPLRKATLQDYLSVHDSSYLNKLSRMAGDEPVQDPPQLSAECSGLEYCLPGYLYGLGGMLSAIDLMKEGVLERVYGFSLGGHHAYADWGHGYCLLNPQAAAARYAQRNGFEHILIVDWDNHHGDGTQSIFANDSSVYCISIHSAVDLYMSLMRVLRAGTTTAAEEVGHCNIPLLYHRFEDAFFQEMTLPGEFYRASESITTFQLALENIPWQPDLILIFSGYDSHGADGGKGITNWTDADYQTLTRTVLSLAHKAGCPVLSTHGGGYKLDVTVSAAVSHVAVLAGE